MKPMLLKPVGKDYLWGGIRLKNEYNKEIDMYPLAETWECSTHPDGSSIVTNGEFEGISLAEVIKQHPEYLGVKAQEKSELPIMIKFIDAKKNLSVQVHPSDAYALMNEHQNGKTEMWYVLDAEKDAELIYGFAHPVTDEIINSAVQKNDLAKHLQRVPVKKGDVFYIPAGVIHAIGKGILIAEIQENSNVTYRVYDYNRIDKNGLKRELHIDKALEVLNMKPSDIVKQKSRCVHYYKGCSRELLCRCKYFETERIQTTSQVDFSVTESSFQVLLCLEGMGVLTVEKEREGIILKKGDCVFIPANTGRCHVIGCANLLKVRC